MDREGVESWGTAVVTACWVRHSALLADSLSLTPISGQPGCAVGGASCLVAVPPQSQTLESCLTVSWVAGQRGSSSGLTQCEVRHHRSLPTAKGGGAGNQTFSRTSKGTRPFFFPLRTLIKPSCSSSEVTQIWKKGRKKETCQWERS